MYVIRVDVVTADIGDWEPYTTLGPFKTEKDAESYIDSYSSILEEDFLSESGLPEEELLRISFYIDKLISPYCKVRRRKTCTQ